MYVRFFYKQAPLLLSLHNLEVKFCFNLIHVYLVHKRFVLYQVTASTGGNFPWHTLVYKKDIDKCVPKDCVFHICDNYNFRINSLKLVELTVQ